MMITFAAGRKFIFGNSFHATMYIPLSVYLVRRTSVGVANRPRLIQRALLSSQATYMYRENR